jgi:hypothetical protein
MPKETDESADSERPNKPIFQSWTPGDIKLLIITIAGTVAANIITVIVVALAIIAARSGRPTSNTPGAYAFLLGATSFPVITVYMAFSYLHHIRHRRSNSFGDQAFKWVLTILGLASGCIALVYILTWIGFAVGIK